jgi:hypothetical protein
LLSDGHRVERKDSFHLLFGGKVDLAKMFEVHAEARTVKRKTK